MITKEIAKHYLFEVLREAEVLQESYRRFQEAAEDWLRTDAVHEPDGQTLAENLRAERDMQVAIEGILSVYARISLFFFPESRSKQFGKERARVLRELTGIDEKHPLGDRNLRNDWMHLDERIDQMVRQNRLPPVGFQLDQAHRLPSLRRAEIFRLLDPGTETVLVLDRPFPIRALVRAVEHIAQQAVLAFLDNDASLPDTDNELPGEQIS
jgi:hypothetical protein